MFAERVNLLLLTSLRSHLHKPHDWVASRSCTETVFVPNEAQPVSWACLAVIEADWGAVRWAVQRGAAGRGLGWVGRDSFHRASLSWAGMCLQSPSLWVSLQLPSLVNKSVSWEGTGWHHVVCFYEEIRGLIELKPFQPE